MDGLGGWKGGEKEVLVKWEGKGRFGIGGGCLASCTYLGYCVYFERGWRMDRLGCKGGILEGRRVFQGSGRRRV